MSVKPNCILLSGASSDIGIACRSLIKSSREIAVMLFNNNSGVKINSDFNHCAYNLNLENESLIEQAIEDIKSRFTIKAFISLASINEDSSLFNFDSHSLHRHLAVNSIAPLVIVKNILPDMINNNYGRIVLTSSIGVKFGGSTTHLAYGFSKHACEFIPSELRKLAAKNIFTNVVRIGVTDTTRLRSLGKDLVARTAQIPARRMATPNEVAKFLIWISSSENGFLTGQLIDFAGGE
mgnify:CR=1 FL=1